MTPPDLFLTILSSQKDGLFFATESCIVGPSSRPRQWKSSCLSPLGGCCPTFLLLYLPHSTLWNLSFFSWVLLSAQVILLGRYYLQGALVSRAPARAAGDLLSKNKNSNGIIFTTMWPTGYRGWICTRLLDWNPPSGEQLGLTAASQSAPEHLGRI